MTNKTDAEAKVQQFLNEHGKDGFLKLFLTNYLFELAMYYLHSDKNPSVKIKEDTSYRFYVDGQEHVYPPEDLEKFKHDLIIECRKKASLIVQELKKSGAFERLTENVVEDPEVAKLVQIAFQSLRERT